MVQRTVYSRISVRIAEEKQLLAEEKWIIDALTKIRKQRNCLMIERLELENLKTQLAMNSRSQPSPVPAPAPAASLDSALKLMTTNPAVASAPLVENHGALVNELNEETFCNEQELNLTVTNPILSLNYDEMMQEEVESDGSEESVDETNSFMIDMNMFMNGDDREASLEAENPEPESK